MLGQRASNLTEIKNVSHRFFGRVGGTSPSPWQGLNTMHNIGDSPARVDENLARVRFQLGVSRQRLFSCTQVHKNRVLVVDSKSDVEALASEEADALITFDADCALAVRTADCVPVLFSSKDGGGVAAAHAGWRGLFSGVLDNTIAAFEKNGVKAERLVAAIGPCISQRAFEVGPEVAKALSDYLPEHATELVVAGMGDRVHIDLSQTAALALKRAGLKDVEVLAECTFENTDRFFSYRAERKTGRQMSAIARTTPPVFDPETFA